jgi:preprotein translocase subunit SecY
MAGVIPVIFAASLMAFPPTSASCSHPLVEQVADFFSPSGWHYILGEALLIIVFTYFYTAVTFNPVDQADNLKKYGGFIPGVRPGRPTAEFLDRSSRA